MKTLKQIRISGFGGQGIILAGTILGHAASREGKSVSGSSSYGAQARGGYARSDILISDQPIVFPHVIKSDILIAMSQAAYDKYTEDAAPDSIIFFDGQQVLRKELKGRSQIGIPATSCALSQTGGKQVANMVMLGAAVSATDVVSKESLLWSIKENVDKKYLVQNQKSMDIGFALGEERRRSLPEREEGRADQSRCLINETCEACDICRLLCPDLAITKDDSTGKIIVDQAFCKGCGICAFVCPKGAITMVIEG